eukprot:GGOE01006517.1.p1 GENE.GGOE01006517.1~~GGOE01006517.1.p1  ORF type:complete len:1604 (+),score=344.39 GGOE01006517.1:109-4920(+)
MSMRRLSSSLKAKASNLVGHDRRGSVGDAKSAVPDNTDGSSSARRGVRSPLKRIIRRSSGSGMNLAPGESPTVAGASPTMSGASPTATGASPTGALPTSPVQVAPLPAPGSGPGRNVSPPREGQLPPRVVVGMRPPALPLGNLQEFSRDPSPSPVTPGDGSRSFRKVTVVSPRNAAGGAAVSGQSVSTDDGAPVRRWTGDTPPRRSALSPTVRSIPVVDFDAAARPHSSPAIQTAAHRPGPRPAFQDFKPERFRQLQNPSVPGVELWLGGLAGKDPKQRFNAASVDHLICQVRVAVEHRRPRWRGMLTEAQAWALMVYTSELYDDVNSPQPRRSSPHQIYAVLDAVCAEYGHAATPSSAVTMEWELFLPLVIHLDAAIRVLPPVNDAVLRVVDPNDDVSRYTVGLRGAWGGCCRASSSLEQSNLCIAPSRSAVGKSTNYFLIMTSEARSALQWTLFPDEAPYLHPLDCELEVCGGWLTSLTHLLAYEGRIIPLRPTGIHFALTAVMQAMHRVSFIYDSFQKEFVAPVVTDDSHLLSSFPLHTRLEQFINSSSDVLVLVSKPGMGKTCSALWMSRHVGWLGRLWVFISMPTVDRPFARHALVQHVYQLLGLQAGEPACSQLRRQPLVLVLDSVDELKRSGNDMLESWWTLNNFTSWNVKLVVTCRREDLSLYRPCFGPAPTWLYLQGFSSFEAEEFVLKQVELHQPHGCHRSSEEIARLTQRIVAAIPVEPGRTLYTSPWKLTMATSVLLAEPQRQFKGRTGLYEAWLTRHFQQQARGQGAAKLDQLWAQAQSQAWELYASGVSFRRGTPAMVPGFRHKSLQEYLVARHVYQDLESCGGTLLAHLIPTRDIPVLRFFGDILADRQAQGHSSTDVVKQKLMDLVLASRGQAANSSLMQRAAISMTLLCAAGFPFQGKDLSKINVPGAILHFADFQGGNLSCANLRGVDMKGAILDRADLRGADLTGSMVDGLVKTFEGKLGKGCTESMVALSSDGRLMVSCSDEQNLRIFLTATGDTLRTLATDSVKCMALSPDGFTLVSISKERTVRMWATSTGELMKRLVVSPKGVTSIAVSADATTIVFGCNYDLALVWNAARDQQVCSLTGHAGCVIAVAISMDASSCATGSTDRGLRVFNTHDGRLICTMKTHSGALTSIAMSSNGAFVVSGGEDASVCLWGMPKGQLLYTLEGHARPVRSVALSSDCGTIASGDDSGEVRTWQRITGKLLCCLQEHSQPVLGVALACDGSSAVSVARDSGLCLWRLNQGVPLHTKRGHVSIVTCVALAREGTIAASGSDDRKVHVWDVPRGELLHALAGHGATISSVALTRDGSILISGSHDYEARVWQVSTGTLQKVLRHKLSVLAVALSSDGRIAATASEDQTVCVWRTGTGQLVSTLVGHASFVTAVALSSDGEMVASASMLGDVRVWKASTGGMVRPPLGPMAERVSGVALSKNGAILVAGADDGQLAIWQLQQRDKAHFFTAHGDRITSVAMSDDGSVIASASLDRTIRLWSGETGRLVGTLEGHTWMVSGVAMSAEGGIVLSSSYDRTLRCWRRASGMCDVWRQIHEGDSHLFANSCMLSEDTTLSAALQRRLLKAGAKLADS